MTRFRHVAMVPCVVGRHAGGDLRPAGPVAVGVVRVIVRAVGLRPVVRFGHDAAARPVAVGVVRIRLVVLRVAGVECLFRYSDE